MAMYYEGMVLSYFEGEVGSITHIGFYLAHTQLTSKISLNITTNEKRDKFIWFKCDLGQKYYAPQVRPDWGSNS